ncbi:beta/gamma crystallin domain-containing protein [Noviherbaspirillum massiliense]|uniref:beta/gamma crystallin domain-containing protein n=1 Tax=Noviherbaspirillum massiliense TaxID=1465823 RepID=UPI0002EEA226|nr:beta/gamma crystallin domain-containing protein [Noviherbaspirillum massiliense]
MFNPRLTIVPILACAMLGGAHAAGKAKPANENLAAPVVPPLIIIAPTEVRTDPTLAKGCWVRLFPQPDFKGVDDLTIAGPIELKSLHTPVGTNWKHRTESILIGPKATVVVYESKDFRDKAATLKPGTQEPQLRKGLQFTQSIDSLKISCSQ